MVATDWIKDPFLNHFSFLFLQINLHGGSTCHYPDILAGALSTVNLCSIVFAVIIISAWQGLGKILFAGKDGTPKTVGWQAFFKVTRFAKRFLLLTFCIHRPQRHTPWVVGQPFILSQFGVTTHSSMIPRSHSHHEQSGKACALIPPYFKRVTMKWCTWQP